MNCHGAARHDLSVRGTYPLPSGLSLCQPSAQAAVMRPPGVQRGVANAPIGLSSAVHIWRGLMKPNKPLEGIAPQPVVMVGAVGTVGVAHTAGLPAWAPHSGQAFSPCVRRTFSATRICSARGAVAGLPTPPLEDQVACLNWRPP